MLNSSTPRVIRRFFILVQRTPLILFPEKNRTSRCQKYIECSFKNFEIWVESSELKLKKGIAGFYFAFPLVENWHALLILKLSD